ncbi:MAG: hypothetical protein GF331_14435, partial [Chitinivibrionales bacterium]|nr:hypothetical protein [Chitinivibrionales bacterium]
MKCGIWSATRKTLSTKTAKDTKQVRGRVSALVILALLAGIASLPAAAEETFTFVSTVDISFLAHATLHKVNGDVKPQQFKITAKPDPDAGDTLLSGKLEIPVSDMDTDNEGRDKNMREMFEAEKYPNLVVTMENQSLKRLRPDGGEGKLEVDLRIRETTATIPIRIVDWRQTDTTIDFTADYDVSLDRYN